MDVYTYSKVASPAGSYDTIDFKSTSLVTPYNHTENNPGTLEFLPGNQNTDFLGATIFGSGLAMVGVNDGPGLTLSGVITTFGGGDPSLLAGPFAQVVVPQGSLGGFWQVQFAKLGNLEGGEEGIYGIIPEPATMGLACLGLIGVFAGRRRS
jgi:hypothetical protein